MTHPNALPYEQVKAALAGERLPAAFIDLDALDRNLDRHLALIRGRGTPLRIASKSIRVTAILRHLRARGGDALRGIMCYSASEAAFLAREGFDDFLVAYPPFQQADLDLVVRLTADGAIIAVAADSAEGLDRLSAAGTRAGARLRAVLCVDMSYELMGGRVHLGVRRSPLHAPAQVVALAKRAASLPGVRFHGLLAYEAQIAGLQDANPFDRLMNAPKALVKSLSIKEVARRRPAMIAALEAEGLAPAIVNGGGVGSLDTTTPESGVTEVTAGSGFFKPHLFDYYRAPHMAAFEPAAFFALEVTRRHSPAIVTCLGGGYVASGPPGWDKVPLPWLPAGLSLTADEAAGEVQTPVRVPREIALQLGDPIVFRHAKGGELAERFNEVLLLRGGMIVDRVPTYRGMGQCFI